MEMAKIKKKCSGQQRKIHKLFTRMHSSVCKKWDVMIVLVLKQTSGWQRVEQSVVPVVGCVVDARVLAQVLTQGRGAGSIVGVELDAGTVQHHQHDQSLLAFHRHVVMIGHLELRHAERAANISRKNADD